MCGAQTGSHPSAASKGLIQGRVSLMGRKLQHCSNVTVQGCVPHFQRRCSVPRLCQGPSEGGQSLWLLGVGEMHKWNLGADRAFQGAVLQELL